MKPVDPNVLEKLAEIYLLRWQFIKRRNMAVNQLKALKRRKKKMTYPELVSDDYLDALSEVATQTDAVHPMEKALEKEMAKMVKDMPCYDWYTSIYGCAAGGLASILAEAGDLSNYPNPAKLWRRMGLGVVNGEAEKNRTKGVSGTYSKRRRSVCFTLSSAIVKKMKSPYRRVYDERKRYEEERNLQGYNSAYVAERRAYLLKTYRKSAEKINKGMLPQAIIDLRAHRYVAKRLLRDLWVRWQEEQG